MYAPKGLSFVPLKASMSHVAWNGTVSRAWSVQSQFHPLGRQDYLATLRGTLDSRGVWDVCPCGMMFPRVWGCSVGPCGLCVDSV